MTDFEKSGSVNAPAQQLFDYLSDVRNLPHYFARITSAEPADGAAVHVTATLPDGSHHEGEAWFTVDKEARSLRWGAEGENDYAGELQVDGDETASTVTVSLHSNVGGDHIDSALKESIDNIRRLVGTGPAPGS